jgi:signal transduction histidine kinase/CheY-like chemotaxis protein
MTTPIDVLMNLARPSRRPVHDARVEAAQVATLYRTLPGATVTGTLLAVIVAGCYYVYLGSHAILLWLALHLAGKLRYPVIAAYFNDPRASERSGHWARIATRELLLTSSIWGLAPWLLLPESSEPLAALLMLVLLSLASAGMLSVASVRSVIFAHAIPMITGLAAALAWHGSGLEIVLAGCCVLYLGITLFFALRQHDLITRALEERYAKEDLAGKLAEQVAIARRASEEKSRFFASASHDLRQPLHAIALFGAVLDKDLKGTPHQTNAGRLMRAVEALGMSLDTMLDVSRLDAGVIAPEPQAFPVNSLFQSLYVVFSKQAEEKGLHLRLRTSPLWIHSDPDLLQRLLGNIIENAIKYTNAGGICVVARSRGPSVWIECYDSGIGIPPGHLPRIFDEFYQVGNPARDRTRGLGIGLAIVRRLADLLGHCIEVTTEPGRGTRFRVIVPVSEPGARPAPMRTVDEPGKGPADLPRRVIVLDDETTVGDAVVALLQAHGVETQAFRTEYDASIALDLAHRSGRPFDALMCDFRLADGVDGLDAALRLRSRGPNPLPVLLVTGETAPDRLQRVHESGMSVLFKPATGPALLQALAALPR